MEKEDMKITQRNLDTEELRHRGSLHADAFTQTLLHAQAFQQRSLCTEHSTQRHLFTQKFAQRTPEELFFYPQRRLHTEALHRGAFAHTRVYTQKLFQTEPFTRRSFCIEKALHRGAFTQRSLCTGEFLLTDALTHRSFYTQTHLHTEKITRKSFLRTGAFTQSRFYAEQLLHREVLNFYAEELLRTEAFTHREVLTQTKLCDVAKPQFHPSFCRLTFMSCEMVASAISTNRTFTSLSQ